MLDTKQIKPKRASSSSFFFKVSLEEKTRKSDVTFAAATTFQTWTQIHTGWWYTYTSEKYDFVSWDDYSQHMEKYPLVNVYIAMERSTIFMVKSTISMAMFNSFLFVYQRVSH